jgi:hypothetical protein
MSRTLFIAALLTSSAFGIIAANAQSTGDSKCGPVAYDASKQTYVGVPCTQDTQAQGSKKCGPVAYDAATQTYVGIPCAANTTDENPGGRTK